MKVSVDFNFRLLYFLFCDQKQMLHYIQLYYIIMY